MKYSICILLIMLIATGCSHKKVTPIKESLSTFILDKDIYDFSNKLNNGDTIFFNAMLGVCVSDCIEKNTIYKLDNKVYIKSTICDIYPTGDSMNLESVPYLYNESDSLNFEKLLYSLNENRIKPNDYSRFIYQIIFNQDTIEFYPTNLIMSLRKIQYYSKIKERLYPSEEFFKPKKVPRQSLN